jgi:hypothetical protein
MKKARKRSGRDLKPEIAREWPLTHFLIGQNAQHPTASDEINGLMKAVTTTEKARATYFTLLFDPFIEIGVIQRAIHRS